SPRQQANGPPKRAATLDVIALLEATLKDDDHGFDILLEGVLASDHLSHVIGTLAGVLADELASHYGRDGALQVLADRRGHALGSHGHGHDHGDAGNQGDDDPLDQVVYELSELTEATAKNGDELRAITRAVERLGDILDKRLS